MVKKGKGRADSKEGAEASGRAASVRATRASAARVCYPSSPSFTEKRKKNHINSGYIGQKHCSE